jgi:protein phosphatase
LCNLFFTVSIELQKTPNVRREEHGPFDIVGDIHGCFDELQELLTNLGYKTEQDGREFRVIPPDSRKAVFLGDLVDRGPRVTDVLRLVMGMMRENTGICVPGNHDIKLHRKLRGKDVKMTHGIVETLAQLEAEPPEFTRQVNDFLDELVSHYVLDAGNLVVVHAGMKEVLQGHQSSDARAFALFGETTGETDEFGLPVRYNWAADYRGRAMVVYGHTPVAEPEWLNRTINIDTGCVFGGRLTALRYPELELISVKARAVYYKSPKPFPVY